MFKHAKAEVPDDHILKELITSCNQAGYDGSLFMQLFPIFFEHNLQLPDANDRKISIICNSQDSLNIQYCPSMPVKQQDTKIEICRLDAILEFTLKSQNGKVEYKDGKVTLTIPEQLKDYKAGSKSLLGDINRHFEDADNAVVESLIANIDEGPKSFVAGSPAEVDSDVDNSFDIIPKSLAFDKLVDIINKAKNGDYNDLNEVINNIREDKENDRFITDLNRGNFNNFCSQQLNLTEHMYEVLSNHKYKGNYNDTVKELVLLAIAANDTLVERCVKMHEGILFTQDEDLDRLLLGAGGQGYIKALLEFLEEKQSRVLSWNNICEKLKRASSIGNQECVEAILNRFEDTESRDPAIKLLHYAVEKDDYDLVNSLIKNGANVNIQDRNNKTALHYAVSSYGDIQNVNKMVMLLVESGAKIDTQDSDGKTALHYAAASNKDEIVRLLLKEGANEEIKDKSGKTFLGMVASETKSFLLNVLHPGGLLHHAAKEGNIDRAKRLLAKGKDVNAKNSHRESPLSVAIQNNRLKIVKLFLEERAKIGKEEVNKAIGAGNLEVIELLVSKDAVITKKDIQYARNVYTNCEKDKKQAHSSVLTFLVDIHNEQLLKKAIEQGDLKKIESYVKKGTVISGEIIQCARDACKICREDKKQAHLSVLTFLMKTSKDQFKEAIKLGNLERVKLFVEKGAVITEKIIQYVQNAYEKYKEGRVCISQYPDGMKAEERNRTEILNFLKDNVRSNSNLVNETATSSQVVNEEDNNQSENPGLESAGSKQPQENVMSNGKASIEEAIGNNYRRGKMSKNKKSIKQGLFIDVIYDVKRMKNFLKSNDDKLVLKKALNQVNTEIKKKEDTNGLGVTKKKRKNDQKEKLLQTKELLEDKIKSIGTDAKAAVSSVTDVSATTSSHEAPVNIDDEKKQAHAQPAEHVPEESAKLKAQPSNTQEQQEVSETPVPEQTDDIESLSTQDALVPQSKSATVLSVDSDEEKQASLSDEVFYDAEESMLGTTNSKDGSTLEGDSDKQEPQPKSVPTPLVAKENSGQVNNVQSNGRQSDNQNNKDIQDVSATISDQVTPVSSDTENNKVEKSGVSLQSSGYVDNSTVLSFVDRERVIHVDAQVSGDVSCLVETISEDTDEVASNQNGVLLLEAQPMVQSYDSSEKGNTNLQSAGDSSVGVVSKNGSDQLPADNLEQNSKGVDDSSVSVQSIGMVISQSNSASTITLDDHKPLMKDIENDNDPSEEDNDSPQNIKKSTLSTIVVSTLVVAAVASIAISVYLEMLAVGIAVGACCLVAAAVIYCLHLKAKLKTARLKNLSTRGKHLLPYMYNKYSSLSFNNLL